MNENLRPPSLQVSVPRDAPAYSDGGNGGVLDGPVWSSSSTPTLRRKRFKMRRMKNVPSERENEKDRGRLVNGWLVSNLGSKEYLQLPSIEITPSSDEDGASWSNFSTPSASPRRKRFLLRKWLRVREKKEHTGSESSSQQSSQQSSHDDDSTRFLTPFNQEERSDSAADKIRSQRTGHDQAH
ncbi:hypothetical protein J4Q44_G00327590 [Coregonus suidteri]|uniref:GRAM domain containing 1B n=1 Tax=Coregonus suidteri TaxID=861788 RepID=A0AAN8QP89_9TELE